MTLLMGVPAAGYRVFDKKPGFRTVEPKERISFNTWATQFNVSSRVPKFKSL